MEIKGKIVSILEMQTGEGTNGTWKKQEYIIETLDSKYPKRVCVSVWGDKIDEFVIKAEETITASIEIESREYNGKWYTNIQAWRVVKEDAIAKQSDAPTYTNTTEEILPF